MAEDCRSTIQFKPAVSKNKGAIDENVKDDGTTIGSKRDDLGNVAPVGETNQSGVYVKKNPNPGFEG